MGDRGKVRSAILISQLHAMSRMEQIESSRILS
jgi:hypothetical protein